MADDEQFSLCWNNFNSNLSAGFHESLCRGDLVDVTLAAEGQFVKAHRLVLSVCSPYFRKMFTQMPANQHAFVFLKDVSHTALKDLIQFMYCGEVNVKQEALPAFISTAEALQIKGLTDSDPPPSQSPAEPSTPTPQIQQMTSPRVRQRTSTTRSYKIETVEDPVNDHKQGTQIVIQTTAVPQSTITQQQTQHLQQSQQHAPSQQIASTATTTVVTHKRPAQRNIGSAPHIKRTKSTIDPLDVTETANTQQITVQASVVADTKNQQQSEPEYIDLPIELPTKSEPDYTDEGGDVDGGDHDTAYVEDDSYGEMRYDESYFTENEDGTGGNGASASGGSENVGGNATATTSKALVKQQTTSFSDSSYVDSADQTNSDAQAVTAVIAAVVATKTRKRGRPKLRDDAQPPQEKLLDKIASAIKRSPGHPAVYASTTKGGMKLLYDGHHFKYSFRKGLYSIFQCCYKENRERCMVRVVSDQKRVYPLDGEHVHFIQATDKSVTSMMFEPAGANDESEQTANKEIKQLTKDMPLKKEKIEINTEEESEEQPEEAHLVVNETLDSGATELTSVDPNDFREKIKKRLQKALLGKKK